MIAVVASAVDDPAWVNGRGYLTDGLVWLGLLGVAVGFIGPKVGWGRWTTHAVGALFAGLLIPIVAGWAEYPGLSIGQTFGHTAYGAIQAYLDIAWRGYAFTTQEIHFVVVLGIIMWGTGQFASYAVFGHHRPLNAVIVAGIVLLASMSSTFREELPYLVVVHGRGAVPAHPDARVRRARDVDPPPDRRPAAPSRPSTCGAGPCSSSRPWSARCC